MNHRFGYEQDIEFLIKGDSTATINSGVETGGSFHRLVYSSAFNSWKSEWEGACESRKRLLRSFNKQKDRQ
jgi:hypothetical protein